LTYIRNNQHENEEGEDGEYAGDGDDEPVPDVYLPSGFIHSPAWSAANVSDCLALRKALGPITLFITFTTNPKWPEIVSELRPGEVAFDRPDVLIRAFQRRSSLFMKDISKYLGPIRYHIRIMEFQKRGLPHLHIAVALNDTPHTPTEIDQFLSAELPREPGPLRNAIKEHMTHEHKEKKYHRCGWPKECQYGFPHPIKPESSFDDRGLSFPSPSQCLFLIFYI
jgi:Helitron helicase-like domain at N-terminus